MGRVRVLVSGDWRLWEVKLYQFESWYQETGVYGKLNYDSSSLGIRRLAPMGSYTITVRILVSGDWRLWEVKLYQFESWYQETGVYGKLTYTSSSLNNLISCIQDRNKWKSYI